MLAEPANVELGLSPGVPLPINSALAPALSALDELGEPWVLLRGANELARPIDDVDLLVNPNAYRRLDDCLDSVGFLRMIAHGRGSHRFYVRYVPEEELWLKLDFVSKIDFGQFQEYPTTLERPCLQRRRRDGSLSRLDPQDEAWIVLLHLLLDKDK